MYDVLNFQRWRWRWWKEKGVERWEKVGRIVRW